MMKDYVFLDEDGVIISVVSSTNKPKGAKEMPFGAGRVGKKLNAKGDKVLDDDDGPPPPAPDAPSEEGNGI